MLALLCYLQLILQEHKIIVIGIHIIQVVILECKEYHIIENDVPQ